MTGQYVAIIDTGTSKIIRIMEPGAQRGYKYIECSLEDGKQIIQELSEALYEAGAWKRSTETS